MERFYDMWESTPESLESLRELVSAPKQWKRIKISGIKFRPADAVNLFGKKNGSNYLYAPEVTAEAVADTQKHLRLAVKAGKYWYPCREQAYKTILDRAHINGTVLQRLTEKELCGILNTCYKKFQGDKDYALFLIDQQKVTAIHSGGEKDYAVLPQDELFKALDLGLQRFGKVDYTGGYISHQYTICNLMFSEKRYELLGSYLKVLQENGKGALADKLMPGIKFVTSDAGVAASKVCAYLFGPYIPIVVGSAISIDHRSGATVEKFSEELSGLFSKYVDAVQQLADLSEIKLFYPVNAMTAVCKKLRMPKKPAMEAIAMFESVTPGVASAADVYLAMHEILADSEISQGDRFVLEENMSRALTLNWKKYDLAKVSW